MIHPYSYYPERAARHWPDQVALVEGSRQRTYTELDHRATAIARVLLDLGLEHLHLRNLRALSAPPDTTVRIR